MTYKFNVGRAIKLNVEQGINILDGDLTVSKLISDFKKLNNERLTIASDNNLEADSKIEQLEPIIKRLSILQNDIKISEWEYAQTLIPYFAEEEIDVNELEFSQCEEFYNELQKVYKSAFEKQESDTGK